MHDAPDRTYERLAVEVGAAVELLWETPGTEDSITSWLSCYSINDRIVLVETFRDGGWEATMPSDDHGVRAAVADVLARYGATKGGE